jgi:hypothetical protein
MHLRDIPIRSASRPLRKPISKSHDELAPFHSITSSARASREGGTVRPSIRAPPHTPSTCRRISIPVTANRSIDRHSLGEGGGGGEVGRNYLHAQDYMVYAHLQLSRDEEARDFMDDMASASAPTMRWQPPPARYGRAGRRTGKMRSSALFKASALLRSPSRSSSDISGSSTSITPPRPTTLGRDSVTPKLF